MTSYLDDPNQSPKNILQNPEKNGVFKGGIQVRKIDLGFWRGVSGYIAKDTPPSNRFSAFEGVSLEIFDHPFEGGGVFLEKILLRKRQFWKPIYLFSFLYPTFTIWKNIKFSENTPTNRQNIR